ncbi:MAG TPA: hypothetical protein VES02_09895 [Dermatophilaceae bacterium]|nr:hypothetical protein [Dermatophilaceae bacterium]
MRPVASIKDLVGLADPVGVRWYEVSGRRTEDGDPAAELPERADLDLVVLEHHSPEELEARFKATATGPAADFTIDFSILYRFDEAIDPSAVVVRGFLEKVAVMAAWPFLREAVATTAARMELPVPVLGLMKQGAFSLDTSIGMGGIEQS